MEGAPNISYENTSRSDSGKKNTFLIFVIILVILGLLGGGFFLFKDQLFPAEEVELTPTPFLTSTPTPTEVPVNREVIKIEVSNGSGISGEAGYLKGKLEGLGYKSIETKNASVQNAVSTTVGFSSNVPEDIQSEISKLLTEQYQEVDSSSEKPSGDFDVAILVGLRKGQKLTTPTPNKSITPTIKSASPTPTGSLITPTVTVKVTITPTPTP